MAVLRSILYDPGNTVLCCIRSHIYGFSNRVLIPKIFTGHFLGKYNGIWFCQNLLRLAADQTEIEYLEEAGIGPKQVILNKRFFTVSEKHIIPGLQSDCLCNFWKLIIKSRSRGNS